MARRIKVPDFGYGSARSEERAGLAQGIVLVSVTWLAVVAAGVLAPVLPKMAEHFSRAPSLGLMIGFVATLPSLAVALFSVPIGRMSDRVGARRILVIGMSGYGLAGMLPLLLGSLTAIVASRFVVGVFEAAVMTASTTLISHYFSGVQRDRWLTVQVASTNVMGVVVVLVGGLAGEHGWRAPFFAYAIALVLLLPVLLFTYEPSHVAKVSDEPSRENHAPNWRRLVAVRCALTFFVSIAVYALIVQMSFLLSERGVIAPSTIGIGIAFGAGGIALGSIANTAMVSVSSSYRVLVSFALMAGGFGVVATASGFSATCAGAFTAGLGSGCAVSTLLCLTVRGAPAHLRGRATGAWTASMFLGQFLNPPLFLVLVRLGGSHASAVLTYSGFCGAIALAVAIAIAIDQNRSNPLGVAHG